jgi:hypothetical protein
MDGQQGGNIGANPHIEGVAERDIPRVAGKDIPALAEVGIIENEHKDAQEILIQKKRKEEKNQQQESEKSVYFDHPCYLPKSPLGLKRRMNTIKEKLTICLSELGRKMVATDSAIPTMSPPTMAPMRLPIPPKMTMMKEIMVKGGPEWGAKGIRGTSKAPAAPTQAAPIPKQMA